eukprot:TRINITY_DN776272_c0_g1_i1.p1 TRINITY_DN776272_c0_g1~~TRINITY_DN776272_c0_g1_i1.p1  ORF type:complete len:131 (-),score=29.00 TRINITY_DN776272_c0_g1_i1:173-565(-)
MEYGYGLDTENTNQHHELDSERSSLQFIMDEADDKISDLRDEISTLQREIGEITLTKDREIEELDETAEDFVTRRGSIRRVTSRRVNEKQRLVMEKTLEINDLERVSSRALSRIVEIRGEMAEIEDDDNY